MKAKRKKKGHEWEEESKKVRHDEGRKALQLAALYIKQQKELTAVDVMFIKKKKWLLCMRKKQVNTKKQKKITDFSIRLLTVYSLQIFYQEYCFASVLLFLFKKL